MSFPLYDVLVKDCTNDDLTIEQKKEIIEMIPKMDAKGHQNIFTLIRTHGLKNNSKNIFDLPYEGQKINNQQDVNFNLDKLPNIVKQMVYKFVCMNIKTLKEEEGRE
jgi:hypothetical protein